MASDVLSRLSSRAYEESRKAEAWNRARNPHIPADRLAAFQQGYEAGWRAAIDAARKALSHVGGNDDGE